MKRLLMLDIHLGHTADHIYRAILRRQANPHHLLPHAHHHQACGYHSQRNRKAGDKDGLSSAG